MTRFNSRAQIQFSCPDSTFSNLNTLLPPSPPPPPPKHTPSHFCCIAIKVWAGNKAIIYLASKHSWSTNIDVYNNIELHRPQHIHYWVFRKGLCGQTEQYACLHSGVYKIITCTDVVSHSYTKATYNLAFSLEGKSPLFPSSNSPEHNKWESNKPYCCTELQSPKETSPLL